MWRFTASILNLKSYYEKTKRKNNINKTNLGNYKHLKRRNIINNIATLLFKLRNLQKEIVRILFSYS